VQRCTVHKERNLLPHAPKHLHDEVRADFNGMMHAKTASEVLARRKGVRGRVEAPLPAGRDESGRSRRAPVHLRALPSEQWRSATTTNAIERLHEAFKRRIKTLPCAEIAALPFWPLLAAGQITMRRVEGWQTLERSPTDLDLAA
jgi:putative transposase